MNEIKELQAAVGVFLGNRDHQPQIGLDHLLFRPRRLALATLDGLDHHARFGDRQLHVINDKTDLVLNFSQRIGMIVGEFLPALAGNAGAGPVLGAFAPVPVGKHLITGNAAINRKAHQPPLKRGDMPVQRKELFGQPFNAVRVEMHIAHQFDKADFHIKMRGLAARDQGLARGHAGQPPVLRF